MPKAKLDHAFVSTAQCQPGKAKTDWYDTIVTGFVFERRSSGGGTYYFRFSDGAGRQAQFKIGGEGDVSFAAAKKRAVQLRSEIVMGGDPRAKKALAKSIPLYKELSACTSRTPNCTSDPTPPPRCTSGGTSSRSGERSG